MHKGFLWFASGTWASQQSGEQKRSGNRFLLQVDTEHRYQIPENGIGFLQMLQRAQVPSTSDSLDVPSGLGVDLHAVPTLDEAGHHDLRPRLELRRLLEGACGVAARRAGLGLDDLELDHLRELD